MGSNIWWGLTKFGETKKFGKKLRGGKHVWDENIGAQNCLEQKFLNDDSVSIVVVNAVMVNSIPNVNSGDTYNGLHPLLEYLYCDGEQCD